MSDYKVPYTTILNITPHTNAERLEVAWIYGFQVIVQKDRYKVGDNVVYIPIDSILPQWLEDKLFPADSKIKLYKHRVRQIKIRSIASQGMVVSPKMIKEVFHHGLDESLLESDLSLDLNITKYEPPQPGFAQTIGKSKNRNKKYEHPLFHKYNGLDNIKWFPDLFKEGETDVVIQEKLHGTNARASILPYHPDTFWKKILKFFKLNPLAEHCYGSNNVQKSTSMKTSNFYEEDIWGSCFTELKVFSKLKLGEIVFGEIIGPGIQNKYDYGLSHHKFVVFDVKVLQPGDKFKWLTPDEVEDFCKNRGFEHVPILYKGKYYKELSYSFTKGSSVYCPKQKVREGIVIKDAKEYDFDGNKRALKWVSEDYLSDKDNTDYH